MNVTGKRINLTIWDTAGQEKFRSLTSSYYRGTQGIILVYDITCDETFENIETWLEEVDTYSTNNSVIKLLIGNKLDKADERTVSVERAKKFADDRGMIFAECSSKTGDGIEPAIQELVLRILNTPSSWASPVSKPRAVTQTYDSAQRTGGCYCTI